MKDILQKLLQNLPQILQVLPGVMKYIPILAVIAVVSFGLFYLVTNTKDPYKCYDNEIYEQVSFISSVYKFKGGYCISDK